MVLKEDSTEQKLRGAYYTPLKLVEKMVEFFMHDKTIYSILETSNGDGVFIDVQTSAERPEPVYWFGKDEIVSETEQALTIQKFSRKYNIEKGMSTYSLLGTDKKIMFLYDSDGSLIDIDTMQKEYSGTYQYLLDCYDLLAPKCLNGGNGRDIKDAAVDTWYQYRRTQALTAFVDTPKLIVRVLSKEPMYACDKADMLIASGGTAGYCVIAELSASKYDLFYIQAWLNHPYTEKLFQIMGSDFEGGFTVRGTYLLKRIPLVELDFDDEKHAQLYKEVVKTSKKIYKLNEMLEIKKDKSARTEKEIENLIKQIEYGITKIYKLQF